MVRFWWQSYCSGDPEGGPPPWVDLGSTDVARLQRGGKGGRHNNVTQLQYVAIMQNYLKHWIRCIIASADLPPATRHFRTWIPLASRGARPEHVQSSRCGASWELSPLLPLPPASPLPPFPSPVPFLPSSAGSNHGRRRDQLHLGGAAPRFAQGGVVFFNHSPGVFL